MQLTNVKIEEAKKVKEGVGDYGPWELWQLTIAGKKYGKFKAGDEIIEAGREIAYMEYDEKEQIKNGKTYKNLSITRLKWAKKPEPAAPDLPLPASARVEIPDSMLLSYIKDMDNAAVAALPERAAVTLEARAKEVARVFLIVKDVLAGEEIPF